LYESGKWRGKYWGNAMKKLIKLIQDHGLRYHELLDTQWEKTHWTRKQAKQVPRQIRGAIPPWAEMFRATYDVLLYDLTSTHFGVKAK
jgi:hypothetical protein